MIPMVFADSNFLKVERRHTEVFRLKEVQSVTFLPGRPKINVPIHHLVKVDPLAERGNEAGLAEHRLVDSVVDLAIAKKVALVTGRETMFELMGLRRPGGEFSRLRDGLLRVFNPPGMPDRLLIGSGQPPFEELQRAYLDRLSIPRFVEIRSHHDGCKARGQRQRNHLADVYHVWCAEVAGADFLVTTDNPLVEWARRVQAKIKLRIDVVSPSDLLKRLESEQTVA
jgi:hypothetical protein